MKKVLLFSIFFFIFSALGAFAYQTILIDWPSGSKWNVAYYEKIGNEAILQYVPAGETSSNWTRTLIVHSYRDSDYASTQLASILTRQMMMQNPTSNYKYYKYSPDDTLAVRSTSNYNGIQAQCEIFRVTKAQEGQISIQYIDKTKSHFMKTYAVWYKIVRDARTYSSYYMDERVMNKAESYEL